MDFILNNWASILSIISFILSCFALYFNWQNTSINKKKFKNEQDNKKKAKIVWQEIKGDSNLNGAKLIKISNTGESDAKNFNITINDNALEKIQKNDIQPGDSYPTTYLYDGLKLTNLDDNFVPNEISAGLSITFEVRSNLFSSQFVSVKCIWDDEFEEGREISFKYIPGNTKLAN
ncbi:TPA: hypothetical protein ACQ75Q_001409 [Bacillus thuringiensis]|nr:hypothetical protein [Bacillus cereus]HDR4795832.1 hypothetical protein [Bacillus cereus]HDR4801136.1 hypothetical protein [Bacillus cereus]HDR4807620.1 hypothetical protein [Bacillus cereus]HDR4828591.1 hypothetical protein [Bacillus cereus]